MTWCCVCRNDAGLDAADWLRWSGDEEPAEWTRKALWAWEARVAAGSTEQALWHEWTHFDHTQLGPVDIGGLNCAQHGVSDWLA